MDWTLEFSVFRNLDQLVFLSFSGFQSGLFQLICLTKVHPYYNAVKLFEKGFQQLDTMS